MSPNKLIEGFATQKAGGSLVPFQYESGELTPWDIHVDILCCGICHSDLHLILNDWEISNYPLVPGHEVIGIIKAKGANVADFQIGDRVGIGWQRSSCQACEWCHEGEENLCSKQEATCVNHFGGFAQSIVADSRFAFLIPEALSSEHAAPLLCGGATVFSPLYKLGIDATMRVGVIGIGGLGHLALQFAHAFGCEVFAFSSSPQKEKEAKEFGAHHFISSVDKASIQQVANSIDLLLCASSEHMDWSAFLSTLRPKGKLCLLGVPKGGKIDISIFELIAGRKTVCGSNIASPPEIRNMLRFAARHGIAPKVEVFPMSDVNKAIEKLAKNQVHYRAVLKN